MNNQLTVWYEPSKYEEITKEVRENFKRHYSISDGDIVSIGGGFKFLFDDETKGEIEITFIPEENGLKVTVSGTWSWEVIEVYQNALPDNPEEESA